MDALPGAMLIIVVEEVELEMQVEEVEEVELDDIAELVELGV